MVSLFSVVKYGSVKGNDIRNTLLSVKICTFAHVFKETKEAELQTRNSAFSML